MSCGRGNGHGHPHKQSLDSVFRKLENSPSGREIYYLYTTGKGKPSQGVYTKKWFLSTRPIVDDWRCPGNRLEFTVTTEYPAAGWTENFSSQSSTQSCKVSGVTVNLYRK